MKKCLVVDDSEENLLVMQLFLETNQIKTFTARSGVEALALLQKQEIEFMISDLEMQNGNGYWLLEQIKTLPVIPFTIIFSGDISATEEGLKLLGARAFLRKPNSLDELTKIILGHK